MKYICPGGMGFRHAQADHITARIEAGEFPPETRLPPERDLADEYKVAYNTLRRAMIAGRGRRARSDAPISCQGLFFGHLESDERGLLRDGHDRDGPLPAGGQAPIRSRGQQG